MRRILGSVVVVATVWLAGAASASACAGPQISVFTLADRAETVALGRVASVRPASGRTEGRATVAVDEIIAGAGTRVVVRFGNSSCDPHVRRARTPVLVFLDADGTLTGKYQGFQRAPDAALLAAVRRWSAASDAAAKVELLVDAMKGSDAGVVSHAALFAENIAAGAGFDDTQIATLRTAAADLRARRFDAELAARYGLPATSFAAHDFTATTSAKLLGDRIAGSSDDAERIEAYERCGRLHGRVWHVAGPVDAAAWTIRAENCKTGVRAIDLELAAIHSLPIADFAAHDFEAETSGTKLADTMRAAVAGGRFTEAMKAYERCWRVHGLSSDARDLPWWIGSLFASDPASTWRSHIATCRSGSEFR